MLGRRFFGCRRLASKFRHIQVKGPYDFLLKLNRRLSCEIEKFRRRKQHLPAARQYFDRACYKLYIMTSRRTYSSRSVAPLADSTRGSRGQYYKRLFLHTMILTMDNYSNTVSCLVPRALRTRMYTLSWLVPKALEKALLAVHVRGEQAERVRTIVLAAEGRVFGLRFHYVFVFHLIHIVGAGPLPPFDRVWRGDRVPPCWRKAYPKHHLFCSVSSSLKQLRG